MFNGGTLHHTQDRAPGTNHVLFSFFKLKRMPIWKIMSVHMSMTIHIVTLATSILF